MKDERERLEILKRLLEDMKVKKDLNEGTETRKSGPIKHKVIGSHPSGGKMPFSYDEDKGKGSKEAAYSSVLMLSLIVFIFQVLFIFVSYMIFKS